MVTIDLGGDGMGCVFQERSTGNVIGVSIGVRGSDADAIDRLLAIESAARSGVVEVRMGPMIYVLDGSMVVRIGNDPSMKATNGGEWLWFALRRGYRVVESGDGDGASKRIEFVAIDAAAA